MKYELTFLLNEEKELTNLKTLIESFDAKVVKEDKWGKRTLVYPIKKIRSAAYYNWTIEIERSKIQELRKKLNYNEQLIRFLLLVKN